jgi:hypothetical protein
MHKDSRVAVKSGWWGGGNGDSGRFSDLGWSIYWYCEEKITKRVIKINVTLLMIMVTALIMPGMGLKMLGLFVTTDQRPVWR